MSERVSESALGKENPTYTIKQGNKTKCAVKKVFVEKKKKKCNMNDFFQFVVVNCA